MLGVGLAAQAARSLASVAAGHGSPSGRELFIGDSTDPETLSALPLENALVVVVAKSGRRRESRALFDYARSRRRDDRRIVLLSDQTGPLVRVAEELRVQRIFSPTPLPHAFTALSLYGAVPAALLGYDLEELCGRAMDIDRHEAVALGLEIAEATLDGAPQLALSAGAADAGLRDYLVGLFDATTPDDGRGVVAFPAPAAGAPDAQQIALALGSAHEVGAALYRFQVAAAICAYALGADPFAATGDEAIDATVGELLDDLPVPDVPGLEPAALAPFLNENLAAGDLLLVEAYFPDAGAGALLRVRERLAASYPGTAVRVELAPNVSFTTARLTRSGPESVVVQVVPREPQPHLGVARQAYDFASLGRARALADERHLRTDGRAFLRLAVDEPDEIF